MAFSLSSIFKSRKEASTPVETPKIEYKGGTKFATNDTNEVYLDLEELGGYPYIKTVIIGDFSTKIKRAGCTLTFLFKKDQLTLDSDNTDIESNQIKKAGIYYTEIDFELNEEEAEKIKKNPITEIQYSFKNKVISFSPIRPNIQ